MKVVWGKGAKHDLRDAVTYIKRESPLAARRVAERMKSAARGLADLPDRFKPGFVPGTREHVVLSLPYIIVYRVDPDQVSILAVFHAARDVPRRG